jgi:hypothetical protein
MILQLRRTIRQNKFHDHNFRSLSFITIMLDELINSTYIFSNKTKSLQLKARILNEDLS